MLRFLPVRIQVGKLAHDRGAIRFIYEPAWLKHPISFVRDPDLTLDEGAFHPRPEQGNFRIFDQDARQAPSFRAGKDSADSKAVVNVQSGVFCCSMHWRTTLMGAPSQEERTGVRC